MLYLELLTKPAKASVLGTISMPHFLTVTFANDSDGGLVVFQKLNLKLIGKSYIQILEVCDRPATCETAVPDPISLIKFGIGRCEDPINSHRRCGLRPNLVAGWVNLNLLPQEQPKT